MKIIFFGTPDFAVPSLEILFSLHEIAAVVTAPDKERGRGRQVSSTPVKKFAEEKNIKILQPEKLKNADFVAELTEIDADLFVVVAFRILPKEVFTIPKFGSFNLHGSLLPKYRGAAPIQWAIINGETKTGLTTFFLKEKVDTGSIIFQEEIEIKPGDNFGTLHNRMSEAGAGLVLKTVDAISAGKVEAKDQIDSEASPAPKITKDICLIDWSNSAENIHNLVRGLSPFPGAYFILKEKAYKIYSSSVVEEPILEEGEFAQTKKELFTGCGEDTLQILEIQPEGRKRMSAEQFVIGYSLD